MAETTRQKAEQSKAEKRASRISAGSLLLREKAARTDLQATLRDAGSRAASRADRSDSKSAQLAAVAFAASALEPELRDSIAKHRQLARRTASERLNAELKAAGVVGLVLHSQHARRQVEDDESAAAAASSLVSQWKTAAMAAVLLARQKDKPVAAALKKVEKQNAWRVDRTAATEVADAYNDEHAEEFRAAARANAQVFREHGIERMWEAELDKRTCSHCEIMHGTILALDDEEPPAHVKCRCIVTIIGD